jgi:hypothetical protein
MFYCIFIFLMIPERTQMVVHFLWEHFGMCIIFLGMYTFCLGGLYYPQIPYKTSHMGMCFSAVVPSLGPKYGYGSVTH